MTAGNTLTLSALLRDTALEISLLAETATTTDVDALRAQCRQLVDRFEAALDAREVAADVARDALHLQCGLLDEMALAYLPAQAKSQWAARPLQVDRLGKHDAGESIIDQLAVRMSETPPNIELIECYATALGLGFRGRYARDGEAQRSETLRALNDLLEKHASSADRDLVIDVVRTRACDRLRRVSPWAIAGLVCVAAAIVFVLIEHALDLPAAHLLS